MAHHRRLASEGRKRLTLPCNNLAPQPTELLGRHQELAAAQGQLATANAPVRLLTLTGPGGTGKTRLAVEIAYRVLRYFTDGVFFVDLVPVRGGSFIPSAVARTLGLDEQADEPIVDRLARYVAGKRLLVVLDNLEHLPDAAPNVAALLNSCPGLQI